jgi:hypothetical protein
MGKEAGSEIATIPAVFPRAKHLQFMDEIKPLLQIFSQAPVAFLGGLMAGVLRLNLTDDPLRGWLDNQTRQPAAAKASHNGQGPTRISID